MMELLPISAPVYGGDPIVAFLPDEYVLPSRVRSFLVFEGTKERQVTEASISYEHNAFQAVIPDHEPPETVNLSVYILFPSGECKCIATENFNFYLDQTCYLARYLADSTHHVESLEDWDYIRGPNFSLDQEKFQTLDERLTRAFQHLILPPTWHLLGGPETKHIPRETLFHFAARLGLTTFVGLLLEKKGAEDCLRLRNRNDELAEAIARDHHYDQLARLISDGGRSRGGVRWERKERLAVGTVLKRDNFGTVSITSDTSCMPHIEEEIMMLSRTSRPPSATLAYQLAWGDHDPYYDPDHHQFAHPSSSSVAGQTAWPPITRLRHDRTLSDDGSADFDPDFVLKGSMQHLHHLSEGVHAIKKKQLEELREMPAGSAAAAVDRRRLSTSCPNLGKDLDQCSADDEDDDDEYDGRVERNRHALPRGINPEQLQAEMEADAAQQHRQLLPPSYDHRRTSHTNLAPVFKGDRLDSSAEDLSPSPTLLRRHSWHSAESLSDVTPADDTPTPGQQKRFSFPPRVDDTAPSPSTSVPAQHDRGWTAGVPNVRRVDHAHGNLAVFSLTSGKQDAATLSPRSDSEKCTTSAAENRRAFSLGSTAVNNPVQDPTAAEADRRFTISEGVIPSTTTNLDAEDLQVINSRGPQADSSRAPQVAANSRAPPPPPVAPKPTTKQPGHPPNKKLVTRKLSFLEKIRNNSRTKPKMKLGKIDDSFREDAFDPVQLGDPAKSDSNKNHKTKRPTIIQQSGPAQRPQSMMITRPSQYSVGNPASAGATTTTARNNSRPVSSLYHNASKFNLEPGTFNANKRSSYHEDDEAENRSPYSHMKDISGSIESLDEGGLTLDTTELDNDPDLVLKAEEPEAWSVTVDKKIVKKMSKKDVKRQENIFEFIQTERNYLTTLKMMKLIFARGMQREVGCEWSVIDKMFPLIDEHVDFVANFVNKLRERQALNKVVDRIGDIMTSQWSEDGGDRMKRLFGAFCSRHNEMTAMYKEMLKNDKKFAAFVKKCEKNPLTRRQGIRECALLVTQRITKYPIMLQTLLDNTVQKDHEADHADVDRALELCRDVAKDVDEQVRAHERRMQLVDIHERTDARSSTTMKGRRFDRKDFLRRNRKLLFSSNNVQWRVKDTKRPVETMFILLSDCIVLLQDNNGKYAFSSGQPASVPLHQLIVREVANNDKGLYLLNPNTQQMYELYVSSVDECKNMMQVIRYAVGNCPDEDEGMASEDDEERLRHERSLDRARKTIEQLQEKDRHINRLLEEKMGLFKTLAESVDRGSAVENVAVNYPIFSVTMPGAGGDMTDDSASSGGKTLPPATPTLVKAIEQVTKLTHAFYGPGGLTRHPSSAGEHESGSRTTPALPKRSDTFGGFDNGKVPALPRDKYLSASSSSSSQHTDVDTQAASDASKRDSGLVDGDVIISPPHDSHKSARETSPSPTSSHETTDMTSYPQVVPTSDQVAAFSNLTNLLNSYLSIAAQQDTYVEKLQQQLNQLQDQPKTSTNKKRPGGNLEEAELKRNQIKQQEQMDDLRKQQQQLKTEREQWQRHQDRYKKSMDREQSELEADKRRVAAEKEEAGRERDEVHRAKDEVQKELTRLRALQKKFENAAVPPIHTSVSLSSLASSAGAASNKNNNNQAVDPLRSSERTLSARKSQSGSSAGDAAGKKPLPSPTYSSAAEYPRTFPGSKRDSAAPGSAGAASSGASGHHQVPLHLQFSATNQLTTGQRPTQQEIPMQLSKLASLSSNKQHAAPKNMSNKLVAKLATSTSVTHSSSSSSKKLHIV